MMAFVVRSVLLRWADGLSLDACWARGALQVWLKTT